MAEYRLFFSWQNDRKDTKAIINSALKKAKNKLKADGIDLFIDQDTRERVGKRNIEAEVLEKIRKCDMFVADLTPVTTYKPKDTHNLPKHMPNSNVMYEYGYALHAKGENRMIVLASLEKEKDEHIEFMPFDINHDTITLFTDEASLGGLTSWIRKIIVDVDKERESFVPPYDCSLHFITDEGYTYTDEITIRPRYKRIYYSGTTHINVDQSRVERVSIAEAITNPVKMQEAILSNYQLPLAKISLAKPVNKKKNLSFVPFNLIFQNKGKEALDNLKIRVSASDNRVIFDDTNEKNSFSMMSVRNINDTLISQYFISQDLHTLNPHDSLFFSTAYVHAPHDIGSFNLFWELGSRTYQANGVLTIHVEPEYEYDTIENDDLAGTEKIIDYEEID